MDRDRALGTIARNVETVLQTFRTLGGLMNDRTDSDNIQKLVPLFENEITRFKMWAGNLAAHQSGPASLDYRLREASHLQEQVIYLLKDIYKSLQDILALVSHEPSSWLQSRHSAVNEDEPSSSKGSTDQGSESGFTDSDDSIDGSPETGLSTLCTDVGEAIDCLLRLSVAIANPSPYDRFHKFGAGPSEDVSFYEIHDVRYVRDKLPTTSPELAEILGKSITRRRQFFKYREAHHDRLASGLDERPRETDTSLTEVITKTVASSLPEHLKTGAGAIDEDGRSEMGMSQTSYATSAGFFAEGLDGNVQQQPPPLKVPPLPAAAEHGIFECPFCYRMISVSTRAAWKRHVFGDLRPYTCLFSHCTESNTDFDRRHRWQLHVSQYHFRSWSCPFKCEGTFRSAMEVRHHIGHEHLPSATEEQLNAATALGEKATSPDASNECPLCGHTVSGLKLYIKHVGRHLEQLALFALPSLENNNPPNDSESGEQNSGQINSEGSNSTSSVNEPPVASRQNEYFVPRDGIDREVINADISRYLGYDAVVRPGSYKNPQTGEVLHGYYITAYRNLTINLQTDSAQWDSERRAQTRQSTSEFPYIDSETFRLGRYADFTRNRNSTNPYSGHTNRYAQPHVAQAPQFYELESYVDASSTSTHTQTGPSDRRREGVRTGTLPTDTTAAG